MAYGVHVASVAASDIDKFRSGNVSELVASKVVVCSHLLAYWVKVQPCGALLEEALDGGEALRGDLRHPLRVPRVHLPAAARVLSDKLKSEWARLQEQVVPEKDFGYLRNEIPVVLSVFETAAALGQGIVTVLDPPVDPKAPRLTASSPAS